MESQSGFGVVAGAGDGRRAVARIAQPDVAVLDIAMPNLSGIEAAQRITTALPQTAVGSPHTPDEVTFKT
jgi:CheY-like chemotaxis protein